MISMKSYKECAMFLYLIQNQAFAFDVVVAR